MNLLYGALLQAAFEFKSNLFLNLNLWRHVTERKSFGAEMAGSHGKRPETKFKVMAKLGENLYKTTKIYRWLGARSIPPKPKWQGFLANTAEHHAAWREWWASPQSERWKSIEKPSTRGEK